MAETVSEPSKKPRGSAIAVSAEENDSGGAASSASASASDVLHGEILQAIVDRLPTVHLPTAACVCRAWRAAVRLSRRTAWLVVHVQAQSPESAASGSFSTHAFDARSGSWFDIHRAAPPDYVPRLPMRSSLATPSLVFGASPLKFVYSVDSFHQSWNLLLGPDTRRTDAVVAKLGHRLVVLGGHGRWERDLRTVEVIDLVESAGQSWSQCQRVPRQLGPSITATSLSAASASGKLYVIQRSTCLLCSFDPATKSWGVPVEVRPDPSLLAVAITSGHADGFLLMAGLVGKRGGAITGLKLWEVDLETLQVTEVSSAPQELLRPMTSHGDSTAAGAPSIEIRTATVARDFLYVYDPCKPEVIYFCDISERGRFRWGSTENPASGDGVAADTFIFTCSELRTADLQSSALQHLPAH